MIVITVAESYNKPHQAAGCAFELVNTGQATLIYSVGRANAARWYRVATVKNQD